MYFRSSDETEEVIRVMRIRNWMAGNTFRKVDGVSSPFSACPSVLSEAASSPFHKNTFRLLVPSSCCADGWIQSGAPIR